MTRPESWCVMGLLTLGCLMPEVTLLPKDDGGLGGMGGEAGASVGQAGNAGGSGGQSEGGLAGGMQSGASGSAATGGAAPTSGTGGDAGATGVFSGGTSGAPASSMGGASAGEAGLGGEGGNAGSAGVVGFGGASGLAGAAGAALAGSRASAGEAGEGGNGGAGGAGFPGAGGWAGKGGSEGGAGYGGQAANAGGGQDPLSGTAGTAMAGAGGQSCAGRSRVCNAQHNVSEVDGCGNELGEVEVCTPTKECANGACLCPEGWTGEDCSRCVRYVVPEGGPWAMGHTWADAVSDINSALHDSLSCDVWVAAGDYGPGGTRESTFELEPGQKLLGGFERYLMDPAKRDFVGSASVLDGDIGAVDDSSDNVQHVVTLADGSVLDGFTITNGNASGAEYPYGSAVYLPGGAGTILNSSITNSGYAVAGPGSLAATNCVFEGNSTAVGGTTATLTLDAVVFRQNDTAVLLDRGSGTFSNCEFENNTTAVSLTADATVDTSEFVGNVEGIVVTDGHLTLRSSRFESNTGIGIYCPGMYPHCSLIDSVFENNSGTVTAWGSTSNTIAGCRFSGNAASCVSIAPTGGGFVDNSVFYGNAAPVIDASNLEDAHLRIRNSTFWGNAQSSSGSVVLASGIPLTEISSSILWGNGAVPINGSVSLEYSDIDTAAGTGTNINSDPLFKSTDPDSVDLSLTERSPCTDRAPSGCPALDILGHDRYDDPETPNYNGTDCDLGAYEWRPE